MQHFVFDTETFTNFTLFGGIVAETGEYITVEIGEEGYLYKLRDILSGDYTFVGFNSYSFDLPVTSAMLAGKSEEEIKRIANAIIERETKPWRIYRMHGLKELSIDHIDLIEVAPSFVSLKAYGARMNMPCLQDLPYEHDKWLSEEEKQVVREYHRNDLDTTLALFRRLEGAIRLRIDMGRTYGIDMRSKSDTQMAEASFMKRLNLKRVENKIPYSVTYKAPHWVKFEDEKLTELLNRIESHEFLLNQKTGHVILPDFLGKDIVHIQGGSYQLGVGGIHSTHDKKVCHVSGADYFIVDIDAVSYYPTIILNCGLVPKGGEKFIEVYRDIYQTRLEAKRSGNKTVDAVLKISLNGTFGKLMERWSPLYASELGLAVTLTGQLTLLCMIEQIEKTGAQVLSANTDGIAIGGNREQMKAVSAFVTRYSELSRFDFEYTPYKVLALKDVNNYLAVTVDKKVKAKGIYAPPDLKKNQTAPICAKAVAEWLKSGTSFEDTIRAGKFVEFLSARNVTGGGVQGEKYLGKVVRWYMTNLRDFPPITYKKNGNKVPKTEGARAAMIIDPEGPCPDDLDYSWYIAESCRIAQALGAYDFLTEAEKQLIAPSPKKSRTRKAKS